MVSEMPRKSLFHRIADSITGFVPSSILPTVNAAPRISIDLNKSDTKTSLKRANDFLDNNSEFELKNKVWGCKEPVWGYANVDLDATDKSESECSLRSFSTSGVSSLMPKSWLSRSEVVQNKSTVQRTKLCSNSHIVPPEACNSIKANYCKQISSWEGFWDDPKSCPCPAPKRQRLSSSSSLSPGYLNRPRLGTTYGGAASCRNARELFDFTVPLKFELHLDRNSQLRSTFNANLSSTARRILETLENFSTPLTSGYLQSNASRQVTQVRTRVQSNRFPSFTKTLERITSLPKEPNKQSFHKDRVQKHPQPHVSSEPVLYNKGFQSQICNNIEPLMDAVPSTSEMRKQGGKRSLPVYTFADPIHKFSGNIHTLNPPSTVHQEYIFTCPSRSCLNCSSAMISAEPNTQQFTNESSRLSKPKTTETKTWRCETCLLENSDNRDSCQSCSLPKSKPAQHVKETSCVSFAPTSERTVVTLISSSSAIDKMWECPTCMVFNEQKAIHCVCCQTRKPEGSATSLWSCPTCMVQNNDKFDKCCCCSTVKPNARPDSQTIPSKACLPKVVTKPLGNFKFAFGLQNLENSEDLKASPFNEVPNSQHEHIVHSNKEMKLSFNTELPAREKSGLPTCTDFNLKANNTFQFGFSSQSVTTSSDDHISSSALNTVISVGSSLGTTPSQNNIGFMSTYTTANTLVTMNPLFSSSTGQENSFSFTFNPSNPTGLSISTSALPLSIPNDQKTNVFNSDPAFKMGGNITSACTSTPQLPYLTNPNQDASVNNETRKKAHAVRRLRR
uniref:Nuclear pore complex protein Nup153 n=1 Tax=Schistosoma japonicum TaxID=6182 RepID=C1LJ41_SCHJA|nr:Nuclear pore complex protein Nup153 [Schistosoma japonicum]